ncbi:FecR family protein [Mucilaginibacter sabulilitoris]|uniref:FecR family protein n=1 Tax=Mucilaginibacter sabulilitoris TaxID=1173583 RepID=A0ABZ0TIW5_9SPHI|nr:FecR family protein [Mucilaginibacter sabulilitoris]WPU92983.1 FecR family protein [Mucilaginibacter sabulilitoris]
MITKEEFLFLYEKNLSGECTPEEKRLLESYQDEVTMPDGKWEPGLGNKKRLHRTLKANLQESIPYKSFSRTPNRYTWMKAAAAILVLFTAGVLLWRSQQPVSKKPVYAVAPVVKKILPGGNKAYLTMANGTIITLNGLKNGQLATQTGVQINKVKDGLLTYSQQSAAGAGGKELAYNMINTPRGGQYQLILADGTKVWLNSTSSLKYPAVFYGKERKVELSGEAYFEVAKNPSKPFTVSVNGMSVQVLGTHFNVMAYNDEKDIKTTLLEGSVKLTNHGHQALLRPGQQGALNEGQSAFIVKDVDVDDAVAWKNGLFAFNNEDIQTIMKRISRWYDVDVVFPEKFRRKNFGGTVSRFGDVSEVLHSLELTGSVHFKTEGRRITVMP